MLTFEKVMEVFQDYLAEDTRYEIVMTSHGYTVLEWDSSANTWAGEELCATPEIMRDVLLDCFMWRSHVVYKGRIRIKTTCLLYLYGVEQAVFLFHFRSFNCCRNKPEAFERT